VLIPTWSFDVTVRHGSQMYYETVNLTNTVDDVRTLLNLFRASKSLTGRKSGVYDNKWLGSTQSTFPPSLEQLGGLESELHALLATER
jgi:hypothetical protein